MTFSDVVKREHINPEYRDIKVMQMFYQEGYMQGDIRYLRAKNFLKGEEEK